MPMDVPDDGFRHVGRCAQLEKLTCMYCRDTGDLATEHIAGLSRLKHYYAGKTQITDRSLEILGGMTSLGCRGSRTSPLMPRPASVAPGSLCFLPASKWTFGPDRHERVDSTADSY